MVEHHNGIVGVRSSNLLRSTTFFQKVVMIGRTVFPREGKPLISVAESKGHFHSPRLKFPDSSPI